uniref:Uncharacterized protein n=1 Tax=Leptocylindrus aporus TaxID=1398097 RepID=A0A6T5VIP0_9STRA|mmetsp:Transcript_375/g.485  ORF Transcript_375/g.485 Transcript_375/m.485 type:complete len:635 (+) Transcript_375:171-2075(+)
MSKDDGMKGGRIRVLFGETTKSYILIFDEDGGSQSVYYGGIPDELAGHIRGIEKRGWRIADIAFSVDDNWYVRGESYESSADSKHYSWYNSDMPEKTLQQILSHVKRNELMVCFGTDERCLVISNRDSYRDASSGEDKVNSDLTRRIVRINENGGEIDFVRLFPFHPISDDATSVDRSKDPYFIRDSEGSQWKIFIPELSDHLKNRKELVCDVALSGKGDWVVAHPNGFKASEGVPKHIFNKLLKFYSARHRRRDNLSAVIEDTVSDVGINTESESNISFSNNTLERTMSSAHSISDILELEHKRRQESYESSRRAELVKIQIGDKVVPRKGAMIVDTTLNSQGEVIDTHCGFDSSYVSIKYDDNVIATVDPTTINVCERPGHKALEAEANKLTSELQRLQRKEREKRLEIYCLSSNLFAWRGLRSDESGRGIFARDPTSNLSLNDAVEYSTPSQYIHLSFDPKVALYYAAASHEDDDAKCQIVQIDLSKIETEHIFDLSSREKCDVLTTDRAITVAQNNKLVLVREYIPTNAIVSVIDVKSIVPRGGRGGLRTYVDDISSKKRVSAQVFSWKLSGLNTLLKAEERYYKVYSSELPHVDALKHLVKKVSLSSQSNGNAPDDTTKTTLPSKTSPT